MEEKIVRKYSGKKVCLTLQNGQKYTCVIPIFQGDSFATKDKYGISLCISCNSILVIQELINGGKNEN